MQNAFVSAIQFYGYFFLPPAGTREYQIMKHFKLSK